MGALARITRASRVAGFALATALTTTGCGITLDPDPTPTAAPTAIVFGPNDIPVGTLLDRSAEAWRKVEGWTARTRVEQPDASESGGGANVTVEEVLLPSTRRVLSTTEDTVVSEEIAIDGMIYMRGSLITSSIYPEVNAETWIAFSPDVAPPDTPLAQRVRYLTTEPEFPFDTVTTETRELPASPSGDIDLDERMCTVYEFTTPAGATPGIVWRIAFDAFWLPCQLTRESGGVVETTTWTFAIEEIMISPPADAVQVETFPAAP